VQFQYRWKITNNNMLIRLHLESYTQFRSPLIKDDEYKLGKVISAVKSLSYEK